MNEIILKRATVDDIDKILEIDKSVIGTKIYHGLTGSENKLKDFEKNNFYLIEKADRVVGYVAYNMDGNDKAYIRWLAVAKKFQGQGIAKKAMKILFKKMKNIKTINLVTHPENSSAINLYNSLGFRQIGEPIENYFGDGEPKIKMVLKNIILNKIMKK
jgi:ribosomal protein S18 acetylase RimI-like enzyme